MGDARYVAGQDILFDDSVWHFVDNQASTKRIAIWADVVRTDLTFLQRVVLRVTMALGTYLNSEVSDTVDIVDSINYNEMQSLDGQGGDELDNSPRGPTEMYDKTNLIPDIGFLI